MQAYKTHVTVTPSGEILLKNLPFTPGSRVEVVILEDSSEAERKGTQWQESNRRIRALPGIEDITEADIQAEIDAFRSTD